MIVDARLATRRAPDAVAMAGVEGTACTTDDWERYKLIVCSVEETCNCANTRCDLDWCAEYVHGWKKEFGACSQKSCPTKKKSKRKKEFGACSQKSCPTKKKSK